LDPIRVWGALAPPGLTLPWAGGRRFPSWDSTSGPSALAHAGRAGHRLAALRCDPHVPAARAGGRSGGRPASGRAGRVPRETWLESVSLRGLGVPPRLAGSAASRSPPLPGMALLAPPGRVLSARARRVGARAGTEREGGRLRRRAGRAGPGLGRAGTGPGCAWPRREGRTGGGGSFSQPRLREGARAR
jgi:hypothetical protein